MGARDLTHVKGAGYFVVYWAVPILVTILVLMIFFIVTGIIHWFVIPILLCGLLMLPDGMKWLTGRLDTFDPKGLIGLYGFYFFYISPLIAVGLNFNMYDAPPPPDWRPWFGYMGLLNLAGIVAYHVGHKIGYIVGKSGGRWEVDWDRFWPVMIISIAITTVATIFIFIIFGGIRGLIGAFTFRKALFEGKGWLFAIGESMPKVLLLLVVLLGVKNKWSKSWPFIVLVIVGFFILQFVDGGLRGSRSNIIFALFIGVGIIHYMWRRISPIFLVVGAALLLLFSYMYGFYKALGVKTTEALKEVEIEEISKYTGRTGEFLLLEDLSRANIQAYILYKLTEYPHHYDLQMGRSYVGDVAILIPKAIWPNRPPTKMKAGTEMLLGKGSYKPERWASVRVYGLAGEAMLNFGPIGVPFVFYIWGFLLG
ncbi:MAG: hypothetical protein DRJ36_03810, partial [Thermoprotei archaeon]